ncbi:hypothetical protein [Jannaschia rubra]|uniref:Peptidoglycan binding domain protein n=1 Tax=Jannaschia rubra TaxID=282197 RepID=A0A0M6XRK0_9RHOB|nr:hypothetical protein [Jannaschia rubra]CTQ33352.1 hypothetical protein JAN5088_02134 [Jannaschia rubra]SFF99831.1 hypothetical protein SAMN04488517_102182 [Jannaschia rubra]
MMRTATILALTGAMLAVPVGASAQDVPMLSPVMADTVPVTPIEVRVFDPSPDMRMSSLSPDDGLPRPSILLGLRSGAGGALAIGPDGEPIAWDNLAAREAMRREDAEAFARLVEDGAFDPPDGLMARALQIELARMNCYRTGIDGQWGRGSAASVRRYVEAGGSPPPDDAPTAALWRHLIAADDVACPTPAPQPSVVRASPARAQPGNRSSRPAAQTRSEPAAPPAAATAPSLGGFGRIGGGIVR